MNQNSHKIKQKTPNAVGSTKYENTMLLKESMAINKEKLDVKSEHQEERSTSNKSAENFNETTPQSYPYRRIRKDGVRTHNPNRKQKVATQDFILKRPNNPPKNKIL